MKPTRQTSIVDAAQRWECHPSFSAAHGTFPKIDHSWGHKATLNRYKISFCVLQDHNRIKLEINSKKYVLYKTRRLNNILLDRQWFLEEISNKILKILHSNTNATRTYQNIWDTVKLVLKRLCCYGHQSWEIREKTRKNLMMHLQISGSRSNSNPKPTNSKKW